MRLSVRVVFALVLCLTLVGLTIHFDATYDDRWPYPTEDELAAEYPTAVGERTLVFGHVSAVDTDTDKLTLETEADDGTTVELVADSVPTEDGEPAVSEGGFVQVYGVLEDDRTIAATETVVVSPDRAAERYKLGVSAIGLLAGMGYFLYYWRPTVTGWEGRHG